jgi:hypothetical protein
MTTVILLWAGAIVIWVMLAVSAPGVWLHQWVVLGVLIGGPLVVGGAAYTIGAQEKRPRLRVAARVLGFVGGIICLTPVVSVGGLLIVWDLLRRPIIFHGFPCNLFSPELEFATLLAVATIASVMAIAGAALALKQPKVAGILMLASGIVAWAPICMTLFLRWDFDFHDLLMAGLVGLYYIFASIFLIPGGIFALASWKKRSSGNK